MFNNIEHMVETKKCSVHYNILPTNGYEPNIDLTHWNDSKNVKQHNCYSYVVDDINKHIVSKPQPGKRYFQDKFHLHDVQKKYHEQRYKKSIVMNDKILHHMMQQYHEEMKEHAFKNRRMKKISCKNILQRLKMDIPNIILAKQNDTCPNCRR